jgi:rare lipoprotein A
MSRNRCFVFAVTSLVAAAILGVNAPALADSSEAGCAHLSKGPARDAVGAAGWRGAAFDGRATATGERFDMYQLTAASADLPLNSYARVTNLATGESVLVKINDRAAAGSGPVITLSFAAAHRLGVDVPAPAKVRVSSVGATPPAVRTASAEGARVSSGPSFAWVSASLTGDMLDQAREEGARALLRGRGRRHPLAVTWVEDRPVPLTGL